MPFIAAPYRAITVPYRGVRPRRPVCQRRPWPHHRAPRRRCGLGFHGDTRINLKRKRTSSIDLSDPSTATLLGEFPSFGDWLRLVPTAAALEPLYRPHAETLSGGTPIDEGTRAWFCNIADAVGIRSRAAVLKSVLATTQRPTTEVRWLSLASGAAQPVLEAACRLSETGSPPDVTLVDIDRKALLLAGGYARALGLDGSTHTRRANVLDCVPWSGVTPGP